MVGEHYGNDVVVLIAVFSVLLTYVIAAVSAFNPAGMFCFASAGLLSFLCVSCLNRIVKKKRCRL